MREFLTRIGTTIAIIAVCTLAQCLTNTKKKDRSKQTVLPLVAILYYVVAVTASFVLLLKIERFLEILEKLISMFDLCSVVIFNVALYAGYLAIKSVAYGLCLIIFRTIRFPGLTEFFYEYDQEYNEWFLQERWANVYRLFKWFTIVGTVFCGTAIGVIWHLGYESQYYTCIFPVVVQIVVAEIFCFLGGYTKSTYEHEVIGEDSHAQKISNFYKIREILEKTFPREVLTASTGSEYSYASGVIDLLKQLEESDETNEKIVSEYFKFGEGEEEYDVDCIQATLKLLKHENVVFFNPFYRDLGKYLALPFMNSLLAGKKCLVIVGRSSTREDIKLWLEEMLKDHAKIQSLWRVRELSSHEPECEVGILNFSQLYDLRIIEKNREFLKDVGFVFILEPSLIVNTGQVGVSILAQQMVNIGEKPVYCIADRLVDGLVDTMSHLLQTEITEVVAPPVSRNIHTAMAWNADGDYLRQRLFGKQTHYLGNGVELAAVAVKNQIPKVIWFGESKVPLRDIKWIASQCYPVLCKYMNIPIQQQAFWEKLQFVSNIWSVPEEDEQFVIAEDEFISIFSTLRTFLSRGKRQTFVNVLSENYLLRDYMRHNPQMFATNPNAIPSLVPDYAKTERNTLLKLILNMTYRAVTEEEIISEFHLVGLDTNDAFHTISSLLTKYTYATDDIFDIQTVRGEFDGVSVTSQNYYRVVPEKFQMYFGEVLQNAYYICEEEVDGSEYLDSKLMGHVTQTILPGQFVTYEGKYYLVKHISSINGVVLRRASNLFHGRKYYRQIREYRFSENATEEIVNSKTVMGVEVTVFRTDFSVATTGYLEMNNNNDLRSARVHDFSNDPSVDIYTRRYHNKAVLRVQMPNSNSKVRYTICMLLSEIFKSIFPNAWQYLAVTSEMPDDIDGMLNHMVYSVSGDVNPEYIYIIEDSELDLGLLDAVEKNLVSLLELVTDFITWHFEKMREPAEKDPEIHTVEFPPKPKKKNKLLEKIKKILRLGKKEENSDTQTESAEDGVTEETSEATSETLSKKEAKAAKKRERKETREKKKQERKQAKAEKKLQKEKERAEKKLQKKRKKQGTEEEVAEEQEQLPEETETTETAEVAEVEETVEEAVAATAEDAETIEPVAAEIPVEPETESVPIVQPEFKVSEGWSPNGEKPDYGKLDGTDIFDETSGKAAEEGFEEFFEAAGMPAGEKSRYQEECYLKFGFDEIDARLKLDEVRTYLTLHGFADNALLKARRREPFEETILDMDATNHCDFCQKPLSGVSYEKLTDGRIRCNDCSSTAIVSVEAFRELFFQSLQMMESFFAIEFKVPIKVKTLDAKNIARGAGSVYEPTTAVAARVLGYAQRKDGMFYLNVENGSPRLATLTTMVHEMTHIWQYVNWKDSEIKKAYPDKWQRDIVYEGMAMWVQVQYLYLIGEESYAKQEEAYAMLREDAYGIGFRMCCEKYPLIKDSSLVTHTPFNHFPPL
ncbi:MAG: hypothetical protein E7260_00430 [Lachnospiraceae bacterium]|nr:hypothetical protein [Lachnospiraceae bacterium]